MDNWVMRLLGNGTGGAPDDPAHYQSVSEPNSIVGRFKALASHLGAGTNHTFASFGDFLDGKGAPNWGEITACGHSCASYYPLLMATTFPVQRLVMTGGVGRALVGWRPLQLPARDVYGFVRSADCATATPGSQCQTQCASCGGSGKGCPPTFTMFMGLGGMMSPQCLKSIGATTRMKRRGHR